VHIYRYLAEGSSKCQALRLYFFSRLARVYARDCAQEFSRQRAVPGAEEVPTKFACPAAFANSEQNPNADRHCASLLLNSIPLHAVSNFFR
jgi:hypothetical protein